MSNGGYNNYSSSPSLHLCCFLVILCVFVYMKYESIFEGIFDQMKLLLMLSPLLLLLSLHVISSTQSSSSSSSGGTPWGVGLMLVLLFFMISYQSGLRDTWFPLLT